jgi:hypothetical protein
MNDSLTGTPATETDSARNPIPPGSETLSYEQIVTSATEIASFLEDAEGGYYLYGGAWMELALQAEGVTFHRQHEDIDISVARAASIERLTVQGCQLKRVQHPQEYVFYQGTDRHGTPLEVRVVDIDRNTCESIVIKGQTIIGMQLERVYLEKKLVVAMAQRHGASLKAIHARDLEVLHGTIRKDVLRAQVKELVDQEMRDMKARLLTNQRPELDIIAETDREAEQRFVTGITEELRRQAEKNIRERYGLADDEMPEAPAKTIP